MFTVDSPTTFDKTIRLPDGRSLGYADCGKPEGKSIFFFHSFPGSRLDAKFVEKEAIDLGVRIICVDRPGMGLSDFQPSRQLLDWPDDVVSLADALGIERFAVMGASGGGPYAAACAYKIPDNLTSCGILAGLGPFDLGSEGMTASNRAGFFVTQRLPWLLRPMFWFTITRNIQNSEKAERMMSNIMQELPEPDREVIEKLELKGIFLDDLRESFRQGTKGQAYEMRLYAQPWGFRLEDITFDNMYLWHGELDKNVPVSMGRAVAEAIPKCQVRFYPKEGHMSMIINHAKEIMTTLVLSHSGVDG